MSRVRRSARLAKKPQLDYHAVEEQGLKTVKPNSVHEPIVEVLFEPLQQCDMDDVDVSEDEDNEIHEHTDEDTDEDIDNEHYVVFHEEEDDREVVPHDVVEFRHANVNLDFAEVMSKMTQEDFELMKGENCSVLSVLRFIVTKEALGWVVFGKEQSQDPTKTIHSLMVNEYYRDSFRTPFVGKCDLCGLKRTICTFISTTEENVKLRNLNCGCYCAYRLWMLYVFINMLQANYYDDHLTFRAEFLAVAYKESQVLYKAWV